MVVLIIIIVVLFVICLMALSGKKKYRERVDELQKIVEKKDNEISLLQSKVQDLEKEVVKVRQLIGPTPSPEPIPVNPVPSGPAKDAFLKNLKCFLPLLDGLITDTYDKALWSEAMVSIDNKELLELWRKALPKPRVWLNLIASWGLSYDACMEFVAIAGREELYQTKDNSPLIVGKKYKVLSNAWVLTSNEGNKSIIKKGIVVQID